MSSASADLAVHVIRGVCMSRSDERILELVQLGEPMSAAELATRTGLSTPTVYRALRRLQSKGLIGRLKTGVALPKEAETSFTLRLMSNIDKKREIASKAVKLVEPGDSIFVDASTTCLAFSQQLAKSSLKGISIVTNSTFVVNELIERAGDFYIVCTGGELQPGLSALVGPATRSTIESMNFRKAFISGAAFSLESGLMTTQASLVEVLRAVSRSASKIIVLVDSTKFRKQALLNVMDCSRIWTIISDSGLPDEIRHVLESKGVKVL